MLGSSEGPTSDRLGGRVPRQSPLPKDALVTGRPGQQSARKHWFPICRNSRKNREQRGTRGRRGREGRMAGEGRRLQASEVSGRVMVREPDPGTGLGAGFQRNWRKGWRGGGRKKDRRRKTTPELPDQVIAVRCQSAAERGRLGRERRDMRRVRAVWDRERTSVKNKTPSPLAHGWVGIPAWPRTIPWATPTSALQPSSQLLS